MKTATTVPNSNGGAQINAVAISRSAVISRACRHPAGFRTVVSAAIRPSHVNCRRPLAGVLFSFAQGGLAGRAGRALQSWRTTLNSAGFTLMPPLYSMKPSLRNLFMKKLTRPRVVPTISANASWDSFGTTRCGEPSSDP